MDGTLYDLIENYIAFGLVRYNAELLEILGLLIVRLRRPNEKMQVILEGNGVYVDFFLIN